MNRYSTCIKNTSFEIKENGEWLKHEDVVNLVKTIAKISKEDAERWIKNFKL